MKNMGMILLISLGVVACAVKTDDRSTANAIASAKEQREYDNAEKNLNVGHFADSLMLFKEFQNLNPQSKYRQSARLGEAKSLEGLSRWDEAVVIYNDVYLKTLKYQKDIAALAMYHLSFSFEATGDDTKAITALLDAGKLKEHLPVEVALAEIPARLAMLYGKMDQSEQARKYFVEAEIGIKKVTEEKKTSLSKDWLVKTYFQMGSISTNQLSPENFSQVTQGQKFVQVYLIRALAYPESSWSVRASTHLKETYQNLLGAVKNAKAEQTEMASDLSDLINQAELYRPLPNEKANLLQEEFFAFLKTVLTQTEQILYAGQETLTLTPESERRNSIYRALPAKKKSPTALPPKKVPTEDPNL